MSVGLSMFTKDERFSVREEGGVWELLVEKVVEEDGGVYECQVTHRQGMDVSLFKLTVHGKRNKTNDNDLHVSQLKAMNDDPVEKMPEKVTNNPSVESLTEKSLNKEKSKSIDINNDNKLLLPLLSLLTITTVIIILGTVRTVLNKSDEITRHQSRTSVNHSRTSISKNRKLSKQQI